MSSFFFPPCISVVPTTAREFTTDRIQSTASLVHHSELNNVIYHNSGYHLLFEPCADWSFIRTALHKIFLNMHIRQQATNIQRSAQMFVRYEAKALPSLPYRKRQTAKTNSNVIIHSVHIGYDAMVNKHSNHELYRSTPSLSARSMTSPNQISEVVWGS